MQVAPSRFAAQVKGDGGLLSSLPQPKAKEPSAKRKSLEPESTGELKEENKVSHSSVEQEVESEDSEDAMFNALPDLKQAEPSKPKKQKVAAAAEKEDAAVLGPASGPSMPR